MRTEFRPARLVLGLAFLLSAGLYLAGLAGGDGVPWWTALPVAGGALLLAAVVGLIGYRVRRARRRRAAPAEDPPPAG
ncbi:hypothetical protein [Streptomyces sp. SPB074]|uniref:hypothetical protein n=1 Tax=Streptomyces sp. (strain SPB074) TaxID=465543 RepID=UPI00017F1662|nr:hypothetical protein [Streptomyces sp. SPB074]EDY46488.1 hypothetical protein SSBG_04465 [Streptomyces sp. SPB074]